MNIRARIQAAKTRAFDKYVQRYGELHPRDPRVNQVIVLGPESEDLVTELLRRANNGEPWPDVTVREWDPSGPYA